MEADVQATVHSSQRSKQVLDDLTERLLFMRKQMRIEPKEVTIVEAQHIHRDAMEELLEELEGRPQLEATDSCPKCGKKFLPGLLHAHVGTCDGQEFTYDFEKTDELDEILAKDPSNPMRIIEEARLRSKGDLTECPLCRRKYHKKRIDDHMLQCKRKRKLTAARLTASKATISDEFAQAPMPPTSLSVMSAGCSQVVLTWQRPMYNGGLPVYEYEVHMAKRTPIRKGTRIQGWSMESLPLISTSCYVRDIPVAFDGKTVHNLTANTDYVDVKARAVNSKGASEWSEPISFSTKTANAPTRPLHLKDADATDCRSFELEFQPPLDNGGSPIKHFTAIFKEEIVDYATMLETGNKIAHKTVERSFDFAVGARRFVVKGLRYSTRYSDIRVSVTNEAGLTSPFSGLVEQIITSNGNLGDQLDFDLREAQSAQAELVDTLQMGFHQRFERVQLVQMLSAQLKKWEDENPRVAYGEETRIATPATPAAPAVGSATSSQMPSSTTELQRADTHTATGKTDEKQNEILSELARGRLEEIQSNAERLLNVKRAQFSHKIGRLRNDLVSLGNSLGAVRNQRLSLKRIITLSETRLRELRAELRHVENYPGKQLDSSIVHGHPTRYKRVDLLRLLHQLIKESSTSLAEARGDLISGLAKQNQLDILYHKKEAEYKERQGALFLFEKNLKRRLATTNVVTRWQSSIAMQAFNGWKQLVHTRHQNKELLQRVVQRMLNFKLVAGFTTWFHAVEGMKRHEEQLHAKIHTDQVPGRGSALLVKAQDHRQRHLKSVASLMQHLVAVKSDMELMEMSQGQRAAAEMMDPEAGHGDLKLFGAGGSYKNTDPMGIADKRDRDAKQREKRRKEKIALLLGKTSSFVDADDLDEVKQAYIEADSVEPLAARHSHTQMTGDEQGLSIEDEITILIQQGTAYIASGRLREAERMLKRAEIVFGEDQNAVGLLEVCPRLALLYEKSESFDRALIYWQRSLQLAKEVCKSAEQANAHEGLGRGYLRRGRFETSRNNFEAAVDIYANNSQVIRQARAQRGVAEATRLLGNPEQAVQLVERANAAEKETHKKLEDGMNSLARMEAKLLNLSVSEAKQVSLEVCSPLVPLIRVRQKMLDEEVLLLETLETTAVKFRERESKKLAIFMEEYDRVSRTGASQVQSSLLGNGGKAMFEVHALRVKLRDEIARLQSETSEADKDTSAYAMRIENAKKELEDTEQHLSAETSALSTRVYESRNIRAVALNKMNAFVNDVSGHATGAVPEVAGSLETLVFMWSLDSAQAVNSFLGDKAGMHLGELCGHEKRITAMAFYGTTLVTGAADKTVRVWDTSIKRPYGKRRREVEIGHTSGAGGVEDEDDTDEGRKKRTGHKFACMGHESAVWSVDLNHELILSGSGDTTAMLWSAKTGKLLRRLRGHEAAVSAVAIGDGRVVTGSADRELRVWLVKGSKRTPVKSVEQEFRLRGHNHGVTAVAVSGRDIVSGDSSGLLIIWNAATGVPVKKLQIHSKAVTCIQFDSTKIISASNDGTVKMTDTMSGGIMATPLRRLQSPVVALQFDSHSLVAVSNDRTLYSFRFQGVGQRIVLREHILQPKEALPTIARKYGVPTSDLLKWNSILDPADVYDGMRLIVQQPIQAAQDPTLQQD